MSEYSKLQELAEAANAVTGDVHVEMTIASDAGPNQAEIDAVTAFMAAATPAAVLELITRNKELANEVTVVEFQKKILGEGLRKDRAEIERLRTAEGDAMTYKAGMENVAQQRDQLKAEVKENEMHMRAFGGVMKSQAAQIEQLKAENEALRQVMACVAAEIPRGYSQGNAPGHCHEVPGGWDRSNGEKSGRECGWCKVWNAAVAMSKEVGQ